MGNSTLSVIYLLNQDVDINDKDNNGCGLIHWAAHFDNVNLLKLAISLGLDINSQDNENKTPLIRAIENYSYNAIQYLLDQGVNVPNEYDINQCKSPDIKRALLKQQNWYHQILLTVQKYFKFLYLTSISIFEIYLYYHYCDQNNPFHQIGIIFILYAFYFIFMVNDAQPALKFSTQNLDHLESHSLVRSLQGFNGIDISQLMKIDFQHLESKLNRGSSQNNKTTFMHVIIYLIINNRQNDLDYYMEQDYCFECFSNIIQNLFFLLEYQVASKLFYNLQQQIKSFFYQIMSNFEQFFNYIYIFESEYRVFPQYDITQKLAQINKAISSFHSLVQIVFFHKFSQTFDFLQNLNHKKQKMEHCDMLNACVENFDHYNWIYQKCICKSNHKQYMILIFMQNCYLFYGLMMIFQQFYEQINKDSLFLSYPIDIAVIMIVQGNIFGLIHYIFALVTLFWNNVFTIIAFSAICRNLTQNELLNRQKYRYLYDTFVDYDQKIKTGFKNQHYKQYLQNLKNYLKQ